MTSTTKRLTSVELEMNLNGFSGTENYYKHHFGLKYTDGVKYLADQGGQGGAYWLIDAIASYRRKEPFQVWTLLVPGPDATGEVKSPMATLTMREDGDQPILVEQKIEYTDMQPGAWKLWLIDGVLILPGEY